MIRFFLFISLVACLLMGITGVVMALGVSDFVAVADGPNSALVNPAGLADLDSKTFNLEHRFSGRDASLGWDDLIIYGATGPAGNGALYLAISQDLVGEDLYDRYTTVGYAYGWRPSKMVLTGIAAKLNYTGEYDDQTGNMVKTSSSNSFLLDFGVLLQPNRNWNLGLSIHNIGRDDNIGIMNYQSTVGVAYHNKQLTLAGEIYNFLGEEGDPIEDALVRLGCRLNFGANWRVHLVAERSDWDYTSNSITLEFLTKTQLSLALGWLNVDSPVLDSNSVQVHLGYRF